MSIIKKFIKYIKENKVYLAIMLLGTIAFALQVKYVVLYADDLTLGLIAKEQGIIGAFKHLGENYMTWGGGPTPFIAIVFMLFKLKWWKAFNCILIAFMISLLTRIITYNTKTNKNIVAIILWGLMYILNIWISRETLYWLDGHLAYTLTAAQLLFYFYYLYSRMIMNTKIKKYDYVCLPLVAFFTGWTGPQTAVLSIFMGILLIIWKKFVRKEKIDKIIYSANAFAIIGCLVEVLAPGNNIRMQKSFPEFAEYNLIEKIGFRVNSVYGLLFDFKSYGLGGLPFYAFLCFGFLAIISYKISEDEKNKVLEKTIKVLSIVMIVFICLVFISRLYLGNHIEIFDRLLNFENVLENYQNYGFNFSILKPYILATAVMLVSCVFAVYISFKENKCILGIMYISALIAQGIMVISPYSPLRSTFVTVLLLWGVIAYLASIAYNKNIKIGGILVICFGIINIEFGIISLAIYIALMSILSKDKEIIIIAVIIGVFAINNWSIVLNKYKQNSSIYYENISRIENFVNTNQGKELKLLEPYDYIYGFNKFVGMEWIEDAVKDYFGINPEVKLVEEKIK